MIYEAKDYLLQFLWRHLTMTDSNTAIGNILHYQLLYLCELRYAVVDKEYLTIATHLEVYSVRYHLMVVRSQLSRDRMTVWRWSAHDTHISSTHQRELQSTRNWCCRHGECIYVSLQFAQFLLCRNTKLLLLIDDEKSEVVPFHILSYQLMRTHEDIYASLLQVFKHLLCLLSCASSRQIVYTHREITQTVAEVLIVL